MLSNECGFVSMFLIYCFYLLFWGFCWGGGGRGWRIHLQNNGFWSHFIHGILLVPENVLDSSHVHPSVKFDQNLSSREGTFAYLGKYSWIKWLFLSVWYETINKRGDHMGNLHRGKYILLQGRSWYTDILSFHFKNNFQLVMMRFLLCCIFKYILTF